MDILEEWGYTFSLQELRRVLEAAGVAPNPQTLRWYEETAPYIVMAYDQGREGKALSAVFPFLVEVQP